MDEVAVRAEQPGGVVRRGGVSVDALVLVMVTGLTLHLDSFKKTDYTTPGLNAIAVGLLGLYLVLDVLGGPLRYGAARGRRLFYGGKGLVLAAIIGLVVVWPTVNLIGQRHVTGPSLLVHDTSINVEAATTFLLAGKDPYAQTYFNTPLAGFNWDAGHHYGGMRNPALWQTDTFPGQELLTVPFYLLSRATLGWFDERFVYLAAFAITILLLLGIGPTPTARLALVAGVGLNPLWVSTFIYGQNDILVLAEILAVLWLSQHGRWRLALLALGIGCATKQTTLILVPFYLWWLAWRLGDTWPARLERLALLLPWLLVPLILMVGPFAAWNWRAFYEGNFGYVAGTVPHSYPIQGYNALGAASFILWSGLVSGPNAYFPFWILEAGAGLPLMALLLWRMRAATSAATMLGAYAVVLFAIFYFSRFFHDSYAAFTIALLLVAYFAHRPSREGDDAFLSFDVLVPLLLVPQLIEPPTNRANALTAAITFGLLLAYVVVAAIAPWRRLHTGSARRLSAAARALLLAGLAEVTLFSRTVDSVTNRLRWNATSAFIHDTALQIQISAGELLRLHNPYTISFRETPLAPLYIPSYVKHPVVPRNLPLTHNAHLPLDFLLGAPFQALFNRLGVFFDERYLYLLALLALIATLAALVRVPARQLALLGAVVFSPLFASAVITGQDDVLVLLALALGLVLLQREHPFAAAFAVGVAVAFKLTAWPLAPLFVAYLAGLDRGRPLSLPRRVGRVLWRGVGLWLPLAASAVPFIRWNALAFWTDAIAYPLGLTRNAIPLNASWGRGFHTLGFGRVALNFGWTHLNGDGYPGAWPGVILGCLVLALVVVRLWRAPGLPLLMGGYLALLFTLEYFGRFMVDTSLGYLVALAPLSFFLPAPRLLARVAPLPLPAPLAADSSGAHETDAGDAQDAATEAPDTDGTEADEAVAV